MSYIKSLINLGIIYPVIKKDGQFFINPAILITAFDLSKI
jgi:hypothetical protein